MTGLRLALCWLTVLPLRGPERVDRSAAARSIAVAPLIGILLGAGAAGLLWLLNYAHLPPAVAGFIAVGALALATRGMHLDGLADTVDGLGCYGPPERAREVMHSGGVGPFAVVALVVTVAAQALSFATLTTGGHWGAVIVAVTAGRVAVVLACRRGVHPSGEHGFGPLVAGTQHLALGLAWTAAVLVAAAWTLPRMWQGPLVVAIALGAAMVLVRHCVRRFAGVSGDVLGAAIEVAVAVAAVGFTFGGS